MSARGAHAPARGENTSSQPLRSVCVCSALLLALLAACAPPRPPVPSAPLAQPLALAPSHARWVEETLRGMQIEEKVGQLIFPQLVAAGDEGGDRVARWVTDQRVGGLLVGIADPLETAARLNALQELTSFGLLVAADMEYGSAMRLRDGGSGIDGTVFPFAMGLAATGDPALAYEAGRISAREARAAGIHWLLAPVADLATEPASPIVNVRAFSADPDVAAPYIAAFVSGVETNGALTAVKHFPGHGATTADSHDELPRVLLTRERLESFELAPFRAALAAGATALMPGHLVVPALTGNDTLPVTLSNQALSGYVRRELGFNGLIVTDALDMRALAGRTEGEAAVAAVLAGADALLKPNDPEAVHAALVAAVRAQVLPESRVDASVRRILAAKARLELHRVRIVDVDALARTFAAPEHARAANEIASRAVVLARDPQDVVPLDPRRIRSLALITIGRAPDADEHAFAEALRDAYGDVRYVRLDDDASAGTLDRAVAAAERSDAVVLASFRAATVGLGPPGLPPYARGLARRLERTARPLVVVTFGDPFEPAELLPGSAYLLAWQPRGPHAQRAAARALSGRAAITGRLPVELTGSALATGVERQPLRFDLVHAEDAAVDVGMDLDQLRRSVDRLMAAAVLGGAVPGGAVAVGRRGRIVHMRGYGALDPRVGFAAVSDSTIYDLASLTKAVATTTAAMILVEETRLDLDGRVAAYLAEWQGGGMKGAVTVRQLLTHTAGLPAYSPLWRELGSRDAFIRRIGAMGLDYAPGTRTVYSDFGMILLGAIVERVAGTTLDAFLRERVYGPLGMHDTDFDPLRRGLRWAGGAGDDEAVAHTRPPRTPEQRLTRIAPTEVDQLFRGTHVHGVVHDENAFAMGGIAGHAGLFSTARDLAIFAQMMLNGGFFGDVRVLKPSTIELFRTRQPNGRALGWDMPSPGSSAGDLFSASSYGHTGFTGTSIWIDPEREVFVVLLTNRVNPTRANQRHVPLRRALHDAVMRAVVDEEVRPRVDR